jgi:menaquinone-9 beta-reductase
LEELGVPLSEINLPIIRKLIVSAPNGKFLQQHLPLGGFGISRYLLDSTLARLAKEKGVTIIEQTKVTDVSFHNSTFNIQHSTFNTPATVVAGTYGKRSNFDIKWKRKFIEKRSGKLNNYIGVKYHISSDWPADVIALHNFKNGYCGISKIEENKYCLCYLTTAANLERSDHSITKMEESILCRNPHLRKIFSESTKLFDSPITISQISFDKKTQVEEHVIMIGDAAGMITPLCGNGMSMALHGSKIAFDVIDRFLQTRISRSEMEQQYQNEWNRIFEKRLRTGRVIQRFFGSVFLSDLLITSLRPFPGIVTKLIRATHGEPY